MREKNLAKIRLKTTKNLLCSLPKSERERKVEKGFEKVFESVKALLLKNLKHDVRLIEKRVWSIEPSRGSLNFLSRILIDRKSDWINRNYGKTTFLEKITWFLNTYLKALNIRIKNAWVWDEMLFQNTSFKPNFSKI